MCNNTEGSHNCTCKPGYSGDGSNCTGNNMFLFFVSSYMTEIYTRLNIVVEIKSLQIKQGFFVSFVFFFVCVSTLYLCGDDD